MCPSKSSSLREATTPQRSSVALMAVGDIMLGNHSTCVGHGVNTKIKKKGANYPFLQIVSTLRKGDIVFGNLEAVLSNNGVNRKQLSSVSMRAMPEAVEGLIYAGFNILSLANNHALEHDEEALFETMNTLSQHNIKYVGVDSDIAKARESLIMHIKGITIAFLAYCLVPDKTAYISIKDTEEICLDVHKTKSQADIVVVSLHWGSEYIESPSPSQIRLAHQIIDSGANIILGHHPHVLQGVESYKGGIIAYSLGNFVFDLTYLEETRSSTILECSLSKEGVADYKLHPVYINNQYAPYLLQGKEGEALLTKLDKLSLELNEENLVKVNYKEQEREYKKEVEVLRRRASRRMMRYFIRNIYRYPPRFASQIITGYLRKHLG